MKIKIFTLLVTLTVTLALQGCALTGNKKKGDPIKAAEYHAKLGVGYLQRNRLNLANEYLKKALKANPKSAEVQHYNALLQARLGRQEKAGKHFAKAVRLDSENPELLNNYGSYLCKQGQIQRAQAVFMKAADDPLYKTPEFALTNAGICLKKQGAYRQAEQYLNRALEAKQNFPSALLHIAELSHQQNKNAEAKAYLYRYNKRVSDTPETLLLCYRIHVALSEHKAAQRCLSRLLANFPDSREAKKLN